MHGVNFTIDIEVELGPCIVNVAVHEYLVLKTKSDVKNSKLVYGCGKVSQLISENGNILCVK